MIPRKLTKVGNSWAVTIPVSMLRYIEVEPGDYVSLTVTERKRIVVQKLGAKKPSMEFIPGTGWLKK